MRKIRPELDQGFSPWSPTEAKIRPEFSFITKQGNNWTDFVPRAYGLPDRQKNQTRTGVRDLAFDSITVSKGQRVTRG